MNGFTGPHTSQLVNILQVALRQALLSAPPIHPTQTTTTTTPTTTPATHTDTATNPPYRLVVRYYCAGRRPIHIILCTVVRVGCTKIK